MVEGSLVRMHNLDACAPTYLTWMKERGLF